MAKINLKNMDYFKFRKYVIDGNRDETSVCSKEVASLCACVQTLNFRDDEFDPGGQDWSRFDEICLGYRQILQGKRVDPFDVKIKSGWWGEQKSGLSAGKLRAAQLLEVLVMKTKDWMARHGESNSKSDVTPLEKLIEGPGVYVFKHKERSCFQLIQSTSNIFQKCSEFLKSSFEGSLTSPISALIVVSLVTDWDFYFVPVALTDSEEILRVVENDLILKHDSIWPHGLNMTLTLQTSFDVIQFRRSCIRHRWPPERDFKVNGKSPSRLDVDEVRRENDRMFSLASPTSGHSSATPEESPTPPPIHERPSSAKIPAKTSPAQVTNSLRAQRPATAKAQVEQKKAEMPGRTNQRSPTKQNLTSEVSKSHSFQTDKNETPKREGLSKKIISKENKHPQVESAKECQNSKEFIDGQTNCNIKNEGQEAFPPKPLKRSNTFTYEDDQICDQMQEENLPQKAEAITQFLTSQTHGYAL